MAVQHHQIIKQVFDLKISRDADGFAIQQQVSDHYYESIKPELEKLFDELVSADEMVLIDSLEIDLGYIKIDKLTSEESVLKLLKLLKDQILSKTKFSASNKAFLRQAMPEHIFERWLYFLREGSLPWQHSMSESEWNKQLLEALVSQTRCVDNLAELLRSDAIAFRRMILQQDEQFFVSLTSIYTGHKQELLLKTRKELDLVLFGSITKQENAPATRGLLKQITPQSKSNEDFINLYWTHILDLVLCQGKRISADELIKILIKKWLPAKLDYSGFNIPDKKVLIQRLPNSGRFVHEALLEYLGKNQLDQTGSKKSTRKKLERELTSEPDENGTEKNSSHIAAQMDFSPTEFDKETDTDAEENQESSDGEIWYLNDVGVVLLHPFLPQFFAQCELTEEDAFKSENSRLQAVHLIYYLATGGIEPMEYQLTLAKVLCGIPIRNPIPRRIKLNSTQLEEADHLLQVVVEQWGVLGDISTDALRQGYFSREGKLAFKNNKWQLSVEKKTLDIMLDRLPWGLNMIKLPWMKDLMTVDWR